MRARGADRPEAGQEARPGDRAAPAPAPGELRPRSAGAALAGTVLVALGAWTIAVAVAGSTFSFDFAGSSDAVRWDDRTWQLSVVPGAAAVLGGLLLLGRSRSAGVLGALVALTAGGWLVVGPFAHDLWAGRIEPQATTDGKRLLLWSGWYIGVGAATAAVAAFALGRLAARRLAAGTAGGRPATGPVPAATGVRNGTTEGDGAWPVAAPLAAPVSERDHQHDTARSLP